MQTTLAADPAAPAIVVGHGAGAGERHPCMARLRQGLADRGVTVVTFDFPYMAAGRRLPDKAPVLESAMADALSQAALVLPSATRWFVGGKSMGGRIASQVLARDGFLPSPLGLVCFGYPLHPPGKPQQTRDRHLPSIRPPILLLHGTRDPFGSPDEMRALVARLDGAMLELIEGGDHSLEAGRQRGTSPSVDRAFDLAAAWILARSVPI